MKGVYFKILAVGISAVLFIKSTSELRSAERSTVYKVPTTVATKTDLLDQLQGDWLSKEFVEKLKQTRSVWKASQGHYWVAFSLKKDREGYHWLQIINFHEGIPRTISSLEPAGSDEETYQIRGKNFEPSNDFFILGGEEHPRSLTWLHNPEHQLDTPHQGVYVLVKPNFQVFVDQMTLAGSYLDAQKQLFTFHEDGKTHWPSKTFSYQVALDVVETGFDHFTVVGRHPMVAYGFERKGVNLFLYQTQSDPDGILLREQKPFLILRQH